MEPVTPPFSARLRALADWCDRHGVTDATSASLSWDDSGRVHLGAADFDRVAPRTPDNIVDVGEVGSARTRRSNHVHAVVEGVHVLAIRPLPAPPSPPASSGVGAEGGSP
jgi:hypothetical protein